MTTSLIPWKTLSSTLNVGLLTEGWNLAETPSPEAFAVARVFAFDVAFSTAFESTPLVHVALTGFDLDQRDSARLQTAVKNVSPFGFTVEIITWHDSRVYGVDLSWFALGA